MKDLYIREGGDWTLASVMLDAINEGVSKPLSRQFFYKTIVPLLDSEGQTKKDGRYLFVQADAVAPWVRYAAVREQKLASQEWIKRRPWSLEDLALANTASDLASVPA